MKLGTKLPPGLINLPKTCLCFPPRRYETLPTSCPKEGGVGVFGKSRRGLRGGGLQGARDLSVGKRSWGGGGGVRGVVFILVSPQLNAERFHEKRKQRSKRCKTFATRYLMCGKSDSVMKENANRNGNPTQEKAKTRITTVSRRTATT